jgi:hypothetical protein
LWNVRRINWRQYCKCGMGLKMHLIRQLTKKKYFQECNDEVDTKVFVNSLILGGLYTIAYILISCLIKPVGRGWVLSKYIFIIFATFSVLMMRFLILSSILPVYVWYVWTSIAMGLWTNCSRSIIFCILGILWHLYINNKWCGGWAVSDNTQVYIV